MMVEDQDSWVGDKVLYDSQTASSMTFMFTSVPCASQVPWGPQGSSPRRRSDGFSLQSRDLEFKKFDDPIEEIASCICPRGNYFFIILDSKKNPAPEGMETLSLSSRVD